MNIIFTIVAALGIGLVVRRRSTAITSYLIADSFVFTFQSLDVLLDWMSGGGGITGDGAFGPSPAGLPLAYSQSEVFAYGIVNLVIVAIGIGLTAGANTLRSRRADKRDVVTVG